MRSEEQRIRDNESARRHRLKNREKVLAATRDWYQKNKAHALAYNKKRLLARTPEEIDKERARDRAYRAELRAKDRETHNARARARYHANPAQAKIRNDRWRKKNKDKAKEIKSRRRSKSGKNPFTAQDIQTIRKLQKNKCGYCRVTLTATTENVDHIIALINGGTNDRKNIQLLCSRCNKRKAARDPITYAQSLGQLL